MNLLLASSIPPHDEGFFPAMLSITLCLAVVCAAAAAALVGLGILSSSALVAVWQRRFSAGWRALHYQACAALGLPSGVGLLWLGSNLFALGLRSSDILLVGALSGMAGSLGLAAVLEGFGRFASRRLQRVLDLPPSASRTV